MCSRTSRFRCASTRDLPERLIRTIVLTKLHAVGLRGAATLLPQELSGGMARRVALARAIAMDPDILIYDEPFAGLDPISMGVVMRLIRSLNDALGITSIVVTHDVREISQIADASYILSEGARRGERHAARTAGAPVAGRAPVHGRPGRRAGAVPLPGAPITTKSCSAAGRSTDAVADPRTRRGRVELSRTRRHDDAVRAAAAGADAVVAAARATRSIEQVYNTGAMSLVIIMTCGLFVGMVLGLQGYDLLQRFGSEESLGTAAALGLLKELGPVVTALLFAGRAGTALAAELGLMRATDQIAAMDIMAVDPMRRVVMPRFLGGVIAMPLLTAMFIAIGLFGVQLVGVQFLGVDQGSFWSQMRGAVELGDVREGLIKGVVFGVACSLIAVYEGYNAIPTAEGVGRATTRTVVDVRRRDTDPRLHPHGSHALTTPRRPCVHPARSIFPPACSCCSASRPSCSWSRRSRTASFRCATTRIGSRRRSATSAA